MACESQPNLSGERILLRAARQLITLQSSDGPRRGAALREIGVIRDGAVLLQGGKILELGPSRRLENVAAARGAREVNAAGRVVMPGFVDCRMQPLSGHMPLGMDEAGAPEISMRPLAEVTSLPSGRLRSRAQMMQARMARHGTTTASASAPLALGRAAARKILRTYAGINGRPVSLIPTLQLAPFAIAGALENLESDMDSLCDQWLPFIARRGLARLVELDAEDVELPAARRFLECAGRLGFEFRVRAGAFAGAVGRALECSAASVILEAIAPSDIDALAGRQTTAVLSPAACRDAPDPLARALGDGGVAVALASGFGLDHTSTYNMQMVIALACSELGMSPAEAISAATINGAYALGCGDRCGSLLPGKRADLIMLNVEDYREIAHQSGVNHVHMVVKNGAVVYQEGEVAGCSVR